MDLLNDIRCERARQRSKQPIRRQVFNQISALVRWYRLTESVLVTLDNVEDYLAKRNPKFPRVRLKTPLEYPLFSLATEDEYWLTMTIINKIDNAYLQFAQSPEEIFLCGPLYRLNSSISHDRLRRYHFETLFFYEITKRHSV